MILWRRNGKDWPSQLVHYQTRMLNCNPFHGDAARFFGILMSLHLLASICTECWRG